MSSWLGPRSLDGGLDRIPLPVQSSGNPLGGLWLCGKHLVGPDPEVALERANSQLIVCLCEHHELSDRYPDYVAWLNREKVGPNPRALWHSIPDLHAPTLKDAVPLVERLTGRMLQGDGVLIHCGAGIGRAPTLAILLLLSFGATEEEALSLVAAHRPMAGPESGAQAELVRAFAQR